MSALSILVLHMYVVYRLVSKFLHVQGTAHVTSNLQVSAGLPRREPANGKIQVTCDMYRSSHVVSEHPLYGI